MRFLFFIMLSLFGNAAFSQDVTEVYRFVEQMPEPGYNVLEYISTNLVYPKQARRKNIEGRVIVQFIVNTDGTIDSARAVNKKVLGYGLEEAAVDLIKHMPKWQKSGRQNGKLVKVFYSQPILFKLTD